MMLVSCTLLSVIQIPPAAALLSTTSLTAFLIHIVYISTGISKVSTILESPSKKLLTTGQLNALAHFGSKPHGVDRMISGWHLRNE